MEHGYSLVAGMHQIKEYGEEDNLTDVGMSNVRCTMKRIVPVLRRVRRRKKGNKDPASPWTKARLRWATRLLVRMGKHEFDRTAKENEHL
jgi:hypothetical protein